MGNSGKLEENKRNCRLCKKDKGVCEITSSIQEQIQYCFDIIVQSTDRFSQAICNLCKATLEHFTAVKKDFKEKEENLIKEFESINTEDAVTVDIPETAASRPDIEVEESQTKTTSKRTRASASDASGSDVDNDDYVEKCPSKKKKVEDLPSKVSEIWKEDFQEYFVCKYCDKHCKSQNSILLHFSAHFDLIKKSHKLIKKHCKVSLNRVDGRPNLTGYIDKTKIVVLDSSTLVLDDNCIDYYITYLPKVSKSNNLSTYLTNECNGERNSEDNDSTTNEVQRKRRKRIRLMSSSSNDSIDVETCDNDKHGSYANNIEHGGNSEQSATNEIQQKETNDAEKLISNIVLATYNDHVSKLNTTLTKKDHSMLEHKVLSIGRRIMTSKQFMTSPGLLKYLEHKNLKIHWTPKSINPTSTKDVDFVHVMTRKTDKNDDDGLAILTCLDKQQLYKDNKEKDVVKIRTIASSSNIAPVDHQRPSIIVASDKTKSESNNKSQSILLNSSLTTYPKLAPKVNTNTETTRKDKTELTPAKGTPSNKSVTNSALATELLKNQSIPQNKDPQIHSNSKLTSTMNPKVTKDKQELNPSIVTPVIKSVTNSKPVELPKVGNKANSIGLSMPSLKAENESEVKTNSVSNKIIVNSPSVGNNNKKELHVLPPSNTLVWLVDSSDDTNTDSLPVITSTTSLALGNSNIEEKEMDINVSDKKEMDLKVSDKPPRIKCKPMTELMSKSALDNFNQEKTKMVSILKDSQRVITSNSVNSESDTVNGEVKPNDSKLVENNRIDLKPTVTLIPSETVVLHTATMPNTVTSSPFVYLSTLLKQHCLTLVPSTSDPPDYHVLIKYKLDVKFDQKSVVLCIILKGLDKNFCINVRSYNTLKCDTSSNVVVETMAAKWQLEILKSFQDVNVIKKALSNAEKSGVPSTELFLNILKAIKHKK